jgi:hypothetical protein
MGNLVFQAALGGQVNLVGPNTASTFNLNVPAVAGNLITSGDSATVTNTMLAGSIANAKLLNSSVTVGSTAIALGASATTVAGLTLTSPTLTTPALGTPASGTLTNCTGLPTSGLTGSISEANGGTGTTTGYYGFKNRIINGAMVIDQRNTGASQTFTAAAALAYSVDRWYGYCTGANVTGQQVAGSTTPTNTQFRYKFTGAASVTAVGFGQRIEQKNSYDLAGSTATLSADLAISATLTTVTWTASYATTTADTFGTLASPTVTQIATGTFTVTSTVTNFNAQITVPAAATTGIQIVFTVGALTAGLTWTIGNVQLEKGSTATSFDYRPYGTEFALCERYTQVYGSGNAYERLGMGLGVGTTAVNFTFPLNVTMRASPSVSSTGSYAVYNGAAVTAGTTFSIDAASVSVLAIVLSTTGVISGNSYQVLNNNAPTSRFTLNSEL